MAALSNAAPSTEPPVKKTHVPAWKRLGLKLKGAQHFSDDKTSSPNRLDRETEINSTSAIRQNELSARPSKKRKASADPLPSSGRDNHTTINVRPSHLYGTFKVSQDASFIPQSQSTQPKHILFDSDGKQVEEVRLGSPDDGRGSRRKSVTFTAETKQEDGASASRLLNKANQDQAENKRKTASAPKKAKKNRTTEKLSHPESLAESDGCSADDSNEIPEYVKYVQQFHQDKDNWKFNKNKQKDLLKNIFNLNRLPTALDETVIAYVAGLSGVGARQRLLQSAESVLQALLEKQDKIGNMDETETPAARKSVYDAALERAAQKHEQIPPGSVESEDIQRELDKGRRALALFVELMEDQQHSLLPKPVDSVASVAAASDELGSSRGAGVQVNLSKAGSKSKLQSKPKRKRKSKSRTVVLSGDDSSSSDGGG